MMLINRMYRYYENYMIRAGRERARIILLSRDDKTLMDLGFSRKLLESGINAWPWETPEELPLIINFSKLINEEKQDVGVLASRADPELRDHGSITNEIDDDVKQGRPGYENDSERAAA